MKIVAIHGSERKSSTYNIAHSIIEKFGNADVTEFFLPRDMPHFCIGCGNCFMKSETACPHYASVSPIQMAMEQADLLILSSPVYVYHVSGQMKAFLDHFGYQWLVHRPNETMFRKVGLVISTAAGGGMKSTNKDMIDSLHFWGVGKIHSYGKAVRAIKWQDVNEKIHCQIEADATRLANKISSEIGNIKPSIKTKSLYYLMRYMQKNIMRNEPDIKYWTEKGWFGKAKPW